MKFVSFVSAGRSSYGVVVGETVVDVGKQFGGRIASLREAISSGALLGFSESNLNQRYSIPMAGAVLAPPIPDPRTIVCVGLNYRAHALEAGLPIPKHPSVFIRLTQTLSAHNAPIVIPLLSEKLDFEGELALVIGKGGRHIKREDALEHIFGYSCFNDASIRDYQFDHSLTAGKNFPHTAGFGPWIATADEVTDPSRLELTTKLNGKSVQQGRTDDLIFTIPEIVEYVSGFAELAPGDVIATGTPHGVGFARKPPIWMKAGDVVEVSISGIGTLRNHVVPESGPALALQGN